MAATPVDGRIPVLINRQYAKLWFGQAVSLLGDFAFDTTVVLWIATVIAAGRPWAPAAASATLVAALIPALVVGPIAGVFVDRWDFRRTMLVNDAIRAVLIGSLVVVALLPAGVLSVPVQLSIVYGVVLLTSASAQFFGPARFAILGDLLDAEDRARAFSIGQVTAALAAIVGPPLAAPLLFALGPQWALAVNAASFAVSFLAIRAVRVPPDPTRTRPDGTDRNLWREFGAGLRLLRRTRVLMALLISGTVMMVGAGSINALDVFFVSANLHANARLYGLLAAAFGIGSIGGGVLGGIVANRLGLARTYWLGLLLAGVFICVFSRTTSFPVALVALGAAAVPMAGLNTVTGPLLLRATPRAYLGRVMSTVGTSVQLGTVSSIAASGWLASTVLRGLDVTVAGVRLRTYDAIFLVAGLCTVAAAVYAMVALHDTDRAPAAPDHAPAGATGAAPTTEPVSSAEPSELA